MAKAPAQRSQAKTTGNQTPHLHTHRVSKHRQARNERLHRSSGRAPTSPLDHLLQLQGRLGNRAVGHFLQAKLTVSQPHDPYEREADQVADTVMRMPEPEAPEDEATPMQPTPLVPRITPLVQRASEVDEEEAIATQSALQRQLGEGTEDEEEAVVVTKPLIQRLPESELEEGEEEDAVGANPSIQRMQEPEKDKEEELVQSKLDVGYSLAIQRQEGEYKEEEPVQASPLIQRQAEKEEDERAHTNPLGYRLFAGRETPLQPKGTGAQTPQVSPAVTANVHALHSGGSPLPQATRAFFEPRFRADFSQVRVHSDSLAAQTAEAINASAFTVGQNIVFGRDRYAPHSHAGQQLLAHELTHVVQQEAGSVSGTSIGNSISISNPMDAHEQAASQTARTVVQTSAGSATSSSRPALISRSGGSDVLIQRDNGESGSASASELIDSYISWGNLDEEALGRDLLSRLPGQVGLVYAVLDELPDGDRDDVSYEISVYATLSELAAIPDGLRIRMVRELVGGTVTDDEEGEIARIWDSFGDRLPDVAVANKEAWKDSLDESDQLNELPRIVERRHAFRWDVIDLALKYIAENRRAILLEGERVGIDLLGTGGVDAEPEYVEGVQRIAAQVSELQQAIKQLRQIKVGYNLYSTQMPDMGFVYTQLLPAWFNPDSPPDSPPKGNEDPPFADWKQVKTQYDRVSAVISGFANLYPSIYVLIEQERLDELAQAGTAAQAKEVIAATLRKAIEKSDEAQQKVSTEDIEFYDLLPVHARLFSGSSRELLTPRFPWEHPFYQDLAKGILEDHEAREFWVSLGLSLLAAAALIAAPFTGGLTAALLVGVGVGIGAGQALVSWERYLDLAAVGSAHVRDELALVSQGQITAALVESILNTVGVFLDAYGAKAASAAQRAARRAIFEASERELREKLAREAQERMVRQAARDAAFQGAGAALAIAQHELFGEEEPDIESTAEFREVDIPVEIPAALTSAPDQTVIQRSNGSGGGGGGGGGGSIPATPGTGSTPSTPLTGSEFEGRVNRALRRGEIGGLPRMDFVIPGQYTGSGWGIDSIGIRINPLTGKISLYHFEMKYVQPGSPHIPGLGTPRAGTQTGLAWTDNAVEGFLTNQHPVARAGRERLRRAMQNLYPGEYIDINRMRDFLRRRLVNAPVHIIVPDYADLRRLYRQVATLIRWGRNVRIRRIPVP